MILPALFLLLTAPGDAVESDFNRGCSRVRKREAVL